MNCRFNFFTLFILPIFSLPTQVLIVLDQSNSGSIKIATENLFVQIMRGKFHNLTFGVEKSDIYTTQVTSTQIMSGTSTQEQTFETNTISNWIEVTLDNMILSTLLATSIAFVLPVILWRIDRGWREF